jgi:hypothetical protein
MLKETVQNIRQRVSQMFTTQADEMGIPKESAKADVKVAYVKSLYEDSLKWRKKSLELRFNGYDDPINLWRAARKLANGQHWDVWGHRVDTNTVNWKHEITRPIIEQQLGVRKTYLTSNVHDVVLFPNVANLNEVARQERDNTQWGKFITELNGRALVDGTSVGKEILDKSKYDDGLAKSVICDIESIFPTPYSTSFESTDGCFSAETEFFADGRIVSFGEVVGTSVSVLTKNNEWKSADIRSFGVQKLNRIILTPSGIRSNFAIDYIATGNHRWFTVNRGETDNLSVDDRILITPSIINKESDDYKNGQIHGIIFGDGGIHNKTKRGYRNKIHLYGDKRKYIPLLQSFIGYSSINESPSSQYRYTVSEKIVYLFSDFNMKLLPSDNMSIEYRTGFLDGWIAMDGSLRSDGRGGNRLSTTNQDAVDWLIKIAPLLGYCITGIMIDPTIETNYGKRSSPVKILTLVNKPVEYTVRSISDTGRKEEVFCVVEPETHSFTLSGGIITSNCWYLIEATTQNVHQLLHDVPDFDESKVNAITNKESGETSSRSNVDTFENTKPILVMICNIDDFTKENIPFPQEEFDRRTALIHEGQDVPVEDEDNHEEYIKGYLNWLEQTVIPNMGTEPEDEQFTQQVVEYTQNIIAEHEEKFKLHPTKKRAKYPFGRRIIVAGDELLEDKPNPLKMPWRDTYYKLDCEIVPGSFWGRGLPEQLWHINETLDTFLSRYGDLTILTLPQKWMSMDDVQALKAGKMEYTNDPQEIQAFVKDPPTLIAGGQMLQGFGEMINQMLQAAESRGSQSDVVEGQSPGSHASGDLVQLLLQQSANMITGEMARNLTEVVSSIHETKIEFYRNFYTEDRLWIINGRQEVMNLSEILKQYPKFQVRVKPNSNFPNQAERDLAFILQLVDKQNVSPTGEVYVPPEFVKYLLGQLYPELAPGGKYYQLSEATKVGLQVMAQQKAKQQENEQVLRQAKSRMQSEGLNTILQGEKDATT